VNPADKKNNAHLLSLFPDVCFMTLHCSCAMHSIK